MIRAGACLVICFPFLGETSFVLIRRVLVRCLVARGNGCAGVRPRRVMWIARSGVLIRSTPISRSLALAPLVALSTRRSATAVIFCSALLVRPACWTESGVPCTTSALHPRGSHPRKLSGSLSWRAGTTWTVLRSVATLSPTSRCLQAAPGLFLCLSCGAKAGLRW